MIKLINTHKNLAFVESNGKGIRWNRKYFLLSTLIEGNSNYRNIYAEFCRGNYV